MQWRRTPKQTRRTERVRPARWLLGGVTLLVAGSGWAGTPALVEGVAGHGFLVDSAEHEFSLPSRGRFSTARGTVELWVQPQREIGVEDFEGVLYRTIDPLSSTQGIQIIFHQRGVLVNTKSVAGWDVHRVFPVRFVTGSWHHLALTWDGTTGCFYVDGAQVGEFPMKPLTDCAPRTYLGALAGKYISLCALDEVHVLNAPLSAEEIGQDYQRGRAGQVLQEQPGRTVLLLHCDGVPQPTPVSLTASWPIQPDPTGSPAVPQQPPTDALGSTDWFQGQWPSDPSMPQPPYPRFSITPIGAADTGVTIRKVFPLDASLVEPTIRLSLEAQQGQVPLYSGGPAGLIAHRTGNHLRLVDRSDGLQRSVEVLVVSHRVLLVRVCVFGRDPCRLLLDADSTCLFAQDRGEVQGPLITAGRASSSCPAGRRARYCWPRCTTQPAGTDSEMSWRTRRSRQRTSIAWRPRWIVRMTSGPS
jgi:hypothetical protein